MSETRVMYEADVARLVGALVKAAGGRIEVPSRDLAHLPGWKLSKTIAADRDAIIFSVTPTPPESMKP